ncbi:glycine-sarcosine methyltransferase [Candidatus Thiomargarita nelsonii]|uniref:Glycine-sarcosine methyltransferase n=1 Tax=Candidatus Thiomargarita nelsonii TaxID=1003181 RepID=A0A0A6P154_9GAMM|nr:glycine-sarcosine methyltransferase [Candidatus Thiomargarita nelsonii]
MTLATISQEATERARVHYNSQNAQNLYEVIIGSDTLNLGIYEDNPARSIAEGMHKTTEWMAENVQNLNANFRVLDIGSGYGPAARYLAGKYGCHVTCINISEEQNQKNEALNREKNLAHLIEIAFGNFKEMPFDDASFDLAWSQDALFHTDDPGKVLEEAYRILKPGGQFLLMDILQADDCPDGALQEALQRVNIHNPRLGSFQSYQNQAETLGFECLNVVDKSEQLFIHYGKLEQAVINHYDELSQKCNTDFLESTKIGLSHWVKSAEKGLFKWGLFHFRRP